MDLEIHLYAQSQPILYDDENVEVINTYTKDGLFCVLYKNKKGQLRVHKYPVVTIFRIEESYE